MNFMETNYQEMKMKIMAISADVEDVIANLANTSAILNEGLTEINWVGFYLVKNNELILGPFQGKSACVRISFDRGVCSACVREKKVQRIADVHQFPGHIACDEASRSEIVFPLWKNNEIIGVLDIDSPKVNRFSEQDEIGLKQIVKVIEAFL